LILLSRTYQLSSVRPDAAIARDPNNEWLASYPRRRLDAEALRDTLLVLADQLDLSPAGPHPFPAEADWKFTQHNPFKAVYDSRRRSVYLMTQRIQRHPYLAIFDGADPATSTPLRTSSTTPLQSLYLLNDPFVHEQASRFAGRIQSAGSDDLARIDFAWRLALGRPPERSEVEQCRQFLTQARAQLHDAGTETKELDAKSWTAFARVILRLNEFVYLD
jgi:hypothetical protein